MRLRRVEAIAFGPLSGQKLELGSRMNVLYGPNEAGKSSWHAAMYAGICGRRRGARKKEEVEFEERHAPWNGDGWTVRVVLELADGREIELHQVLDEPGESRAVDRLTGRDVTGELDLLSDGAPDASRLLGLSRETMMATATVRQAEIHRVQEEADALQSQLQAATSKAGADTTAEAAIRRLEDYHREHVGLRRANSKRPLQAAINRLAGARETLGEAQRAHADYLRLVVRREEAEEEASEWQRKLGSARHLERLRRLEAERGRLDRARDLSAGLPDGDIPDLDALEGEEDRIREALTRWAERPAETEPPAGRSVEELEQALAALPAQPQGDTEVASEVRATYRSWQRAGADLEAHDRYRPDTAVVAEPDESAPDPTELRRFAEALEAAEPRVDESLAGQLDELERRLRPGTARLVARFAGVALLLGALVALLLGRETAWWALPGAAGIVALALGLLPRGDRRRIERERRTVETELALATAQIRSWEDKRREAQQRLMELDLPADPDHLRRLAGRIERTDTQRLELETWAREREALVTRLEEREGALAGALASRLEPEDPAMDLEARFELYEEQCDERRELARRAAQRADLEQSVADRRQLEAKVEEARRKRSDAEEALLALAEELGVPGENAKQAADRLRTRADGIESELPAWHRAEVAAAQLEELLGGKDLDVLEAEVTALAEQIATEPEGFEEVDLGEDPEATLARIQTEHDRAREALSHLDGRIADREKSLPSVPEAEENLEQARAELERAQGLETTLQKTLEFLEAARERVQRDIAPHLRRALEADLATVTGGRYTKARVDPADLEVTVQDADGNWRSASLLSHGTTEQIYLLLRLALVRHMCAVGEPSPVFLDDPTVQCDAVRTAAILDVLNELSSEHQIIVFSQEDEVKRWAEAQADAEAVRLIELGS